MSYSDDVSADANNIAEIARDSKDQHNKVLSRINEVSNYWKGESYEAFRTKFAGREQDTRTMHNKLDSVYSALRDLKKAIDQADDERRQEAARQQEVARQQEAARRQQS